MSTRRRWRSPPSRRCARARRVSCLRLGATSISTGCDNIQPWCISRQLWWGHQIPAWYGPDGEIFVATTEAEAAAHRRKTALRQESRADSATRTCSTPGSRRRCGRSRRWAGRTRRRSSKRYYPTSVLVTGFDIIFFWVARMMMMGMHFMKRGAVPRRLYPRAGPRREGREDVEVEGQRHRSAVGDRRIRRRRAALHAGRDGGAGPRHQAVAAARRGQPQLRDQAVERGALLRNERLRARRPASIRPRRRPRSTAGSVPRPAPTVPP